MKRGIFYRLLVSLLLLFVVSSAVVAYILLNESEYILEKSRQKHARTIAQGLAQGSLDALVVKDYELLERALLTAVPIDDFAYAYLSRADGIILSHTDIDSISSRSRVLGEIHGFHTFEMKFNDRPVREVVYPAYLSDKHLANAHVAYYSDTQLFLHDRVIIRTLVLLFISLFLLSLSTFFILKWGLEPIKSLLGVIKKITQSQNYELRAHKTSQDEIGELVDAFNIMLELINCRGQDLLEEKENALQLAIQAKHYAESLERTNIDLEDEINERKRVESDLNELSQTLEKKVKDRTKKLEELNEKIASISRSAGMAEVATGVLHNVGNVLNSVNVSGSIIREKVLNSKVQRLSNIVEMLLDNIGNLDDFIEHDAKGKLVPGFLKLLVDTLKEEQQDLLKEIEVLDQHVEHVKKVIKMQQGYAGKFGVIEVVNMQELIKDAIQISKQKTGFESLDIEYDFQQVNDIHIDKHKALQVLINLTSNAMNAISESDANIKCLSINLFQRDNMLVVEIIDTGVGIAQQDLKRLFEYGFSRRSGGHGFGLHHSALVVKEMNGNIYATSGGKGKGATFTIELPIKIKQQKGVGDK